MANRPVAKLSERCLFIRYSLRAEIPYLHQEYSPLMSHPGLRIQSSHHALLTVLMISPRRELLEERFSHPRHAGGIRFLRWEFKKGQEHTRSSGFAAHHAMPRT